MDLMVLAQGFMEEKKKRLCIELSEKYGVPPKEIDDVVSTFLQDRFGKAEQLAFTICSKLRPVLLFISRKDCGICQRSWPHVESFLKKHMDIDLVKVDYSSPEGLLYHIIQQKDSGMLPLIAMIHQGSIKMIFTGECVHDSTYEKYYCNIASESS